LSRETISAIAESSAKNQRGAKPKAKKRRDFTTENTEVTEQQIRNGELTTKNAKGAKREARYKVRV
jgi:predicted kinase